MKAITSILHSAAVFVLFVFSASSFAGTPTSDAGDATEVPPALAGLNVTLLPDAEANDVRGTASYSWVFTAGKWVLKKSIPGLVWRATTYAQCGTFTLACKAK